MLFGAIETGGTKFVVAVGDERNNIINKCTLPTTTPNETMPLVLQFLSQYNLEGIGVGSFGPIDTNSVSSYYGFITSTPKEAWRDFDFVGRLKQEFDIPITWTTDVNAAGYGEYHWGNASDVNSCLYLTIGTGIGGGFIQNDNILNAYSHPEMGHLLVRKHSKDNFKGICPAHGDCLEGLASGKAIEARWGQDGRKLKHNMMVWEIESYYIAQALINYTFILRPERIILGGGVTKQKHLFPLIREKFLDMLGDYVVTPEITQYIQPVGLSESGIMGGILLAKRSKSS